MSFEIPSSSEGLSTNEKVIDINLKVLEAQESLKSFGLTIGDDGLVEGPFSKSQIDRLRQWSDETSSHGALMPTVENFCEKTLLAVSLWRQRDEQGRINYLMGKGSGVEMALLGDVKGRKKRVGSFSFRPHSDFELYGVDQEKCIYTDEFVAVFDAQEYFPKTKTKGLSDLPPELLDETAEIVEFGSATIIIPQLELLFLDKWRARESTPRPEGFDDECLARAYELNIALLHSYLEKYVLDNDRKKIELEFTDKAAKHIESMERKIRSYLKNGMDHKNSAYFLDRDMSMLSASKQDVELNGISSRLWKPLEDEKQFDEYGNLVDEQLKRYIHQRSDELKTEALRIIEQLPSQLDEYFLSLEKEAEI